MLVGNGHASAPLRRDGPPDPPGDSCCEHRGKRSVMVDMQVIVRRQDQELCASITCMIRHYVARRAKVIFDHPHNADESAFYADHPDVGEKGMNTSLNG